jgi:hypothetical protein
MMDEDIFFTITEEGVLGELHACNRMAEDEALSASPSPLHTNRSGTTKSVQNNSLVPETSMLSQADLYCIIPSYSLHPQISDLSFRRYKVIYNNNKLDLLDPW